MPPAGKIHSSDSPPGSHLRLSADWRLPRAWFSYWWRFLDDGDLLCSSLNHPIDTTPECFLEPSCPWIVATLLCVYKAAVTPEGRGRLFSRKVSSGPAGFLRLVKILKTFSSHIPSRPKSNVISFSLQQEAISRLLDILSPLR